MMKHFKNIFVIFETKKQKFNFKTKHKFEIKREKFEKKILINSKILKKISLKVFNDVNSTNSIKFIKKIKPNVVITFGVGLIKKKFLSLFKKNNIINLHGGNPEEYRGLDSILWSLYHKDFNNLYTTLHYVDEKFDTGKIISKLNIPLNKKTKFEHIRFYNTINCVKLIKNYLKKLIMKKKIISFKQKKIGRYYSAIPAKLIDISIKNFHLYIKKLK